MSSEYEFGRRRLRVIVLTIAVLALVGAGVNYYINHRALGRTGSRVVSGSGSFHIGTIPRSYYASYQVDTRAGGPRVLTTEKTWVLRPFDSRIETWSGKKRLSVRQSAFGALANFSPQAAPLSIATPPTIASGDLRLDASLDDAVRRHIIVKRERRNVYGRVCQVYRAGGPVSAGDITKYTPGSTEYADFCIDRSGIVVEEWWIRNNKLLRRRVATTVRIGEVNTDLFEIKQPPDEGIDKGTIQQVSGNGGQKLWTLPSAPKGFVYIGRFFVALPSGANSNPTPALGETPPVSSLTDVYTDGAQLVVVDQDPSLEAAAAAENRTTYKVTLKGFKNAVLVVDARESEIRAETSDGSFVRVAGTLPAERLLELARSLRLSGG